MSLRCEFNDKDEWRPPDFIGVVMTGGGWDVVTPGEEKSVKYVRLDPMSDIYEAALKDNKEVHALCERLQEQVERVENERNMAIKILRDLVTHPLTDNIADVDNFLDQYEDLYDR